MHWAVQRESRSDHTEPNGDVLTALTANEEMMSPNFDMLMRS